MRQGLMARRNLLALGVVALIAGAVTWAVLSHRDDANSTVRYAVAWHLTPGQALTPASKSVNVEVDDSRCADGVPGADRLRAPQVAYAQRTVTIRLWAELSKGFHTCPSRVGEGANTATIRLDEPLGDRSLVDGNADAAASS